MNWRLSSSQAWEKNELEYRESRIRRQRKSCVSKSLCKPLGDNAASHTGMGENSLCSNHLDIAFAEYGANSLKHCILIDMSSGHIILGLGGPREKRRERSSSMQNGHSQKFHYFNH